MWQSDADTRLLATSVVDATRRWHAMTVPSPIWGDFRDFVECPEDRVEWHAPAQLADGRKLLCRFIPLSDGGTQVIFSLTSEVSLTPDNLLAAV